MIVSQKPLLLMDDSKLQLSVYPSRQANPFPSEPLFLSSSGSLTDLSRENVTVYSGESAGTKVEAELVHSLQGTVEHPTPSSALTLPEIYACFFVFFFFKSGEFWSPPSWAVLTGFTL